MLIPFPRGGMRSALPALRALCILCALAPGLSFPQTWPERPIKWVVPAEPGSVADASARAVAEPLAGILRQPIVIHNMPGASGNLGARFAARAAPDGYTWIYSSSIMAASMRMFKEPGFDLLHDFQQVACLSVGDSVLVVNADAGIDTVKALIEQMRGSPGKVAYGSSGIGTPSHLGAALLLSRTNAEGLHVPYNGAPSLLNALLSRQITFAMPVTSAALGHIQAGKLRALAVTGDQRNPRLPDVPTLAEAGLPGIVITTFAGLAVPAGTPEAIVARLRTSLRDVVERPEIRTRIGLLGATPRFEAGEACTRDFVAAMDLTERMMSAAGLGAQ